MLVLVLCGFHLVLTNALVQQGYNYPSNNGQNQVLYNTNHQNVDYSNKLDPFQQQALSHQPVVQHIHQNVPVQKNGFLPAAEFGVPNGPPVPEFTAGQSYQSNQYLPPQFNGVTQSGNYYPDNTVDPNSPGYYNPRTHYRIVLTLPRPHRVALPHEPTVEEKTLIYVLREKPDEAHLPIEPPKFVSSKPEVYFINYKTKKKIPAESDGPTGVDDGTGPLPSAEGSAEQSAQLPLEHRSNSGSDFGLSTLAPPLSTPLPTAQPTQYLPPQQQVDGHSQQQAQYLPPPQPVGGHSQQQAQYLPPPQPVGGHSQPQAQYLPPHQSAPELRIGAESGHLHQVQPTSQPSVASTTLATHVSYAPQYSADASLPPTQATFASTPNQAGAITYSIHKSIERTFAPVTSQSRAYLHP